MAKAFASRGVCQRLFDAFEGSAEFGEVWVVPADAGPVVADPLGALGGVPVRIFRNGASVFGAACGVGTVVALVAGAAEFAGAPFSTATGFTRPFA